MKYICDFDDLFDGNIHKLSVLEKIHERLPDFKATLFTIPNRTSPETIAFVKETYPYLTLAPHGWEHTKGECYSWTLTEGRDKMEQAKDKGIDAPVFRAPGWLIGGCCYQLAGEFGWTIASHRDMHLPSTRKRDDFSWTDVPQYIYNSPTGKLKGYRAVHGHVTPVSGNHILDMEKDGRLFFLQGDEFFYPWEASVLIEEQKEEE